MPSDNNITILLVERTTSATQVLFYQDERGRAPVVEWLRDGVYELRARHGYAQYRMLYFFHGHNVAVLGNAIIKKSFAVPPKEIEQALERKRAFEANPDAHTYQGDLSDA